VTSPAHQLPLGTSRADELLEDFLDYHRCHPRVWQLFERFAEEARDAGMRRCSADFILHRIRWEVAVQARDADGFKLNDHYSAFYARLYLAKHPRAHGFFRTRRRPSASLAAWTETRDEPGREDDHLGEALADLVRAGEA